MFVVDKGAVGPQLPGDFFAGEQLAGPVEQHQEYLEGLGVELDAETLPAKFSGGGVCFERLRSDSAALAVGRSCLMSSVFDCELDSALAPPKYNFSESQVLQSLAR